MTYIPRLMCADCGLEYKPEKNGVTTEVMIPDEEGHRPYYKIQGDLWYCQSCGTSVIIPAQRPLDMHFDSGYDNQDVEYTVKLR